MRVRVSTSAGCSCKLTINSAGRGVSDAVHAIAAKAEEAARGVGRTASATSGARGVVDGGGGGVRQLVRETGGVPHADGRWTWGTCDGNDAQVQLVSAVSAGRLDGHVHACVNAQEACSHQLLTSGAA